MGRSPCCDKAGLKKGPWTPEEDQKLLAYIEEHGHGSWRALPNKAGLQRCGKSCRLRWTNYLRPDIKRGKFTGQEEQTIIQLHALLGNRWSSIATHLPKRTDNEIKNYWNTHLKKRLTKMGIDPVSHKPKNDTFLSGDAQSKSVANLSHMAQWESARLEADGNEDLESPTSTLSTTGVVESSTNFFEFVGGNSSRSWDDGTVGEKCDEEWECKDENQMDNSIRVYNGNGINVAFIHNNENNNNNYEEHTPQGNFLESFTDLLLSSSGTSNRRSGQANGGSKVALEPKEVNNTYYEDNNKNYWNSILNLVNSSLQDP